MGYNILDTFSGCGGFSYGFIDPSNKFFAIEKNPIPARTYQDNILNSEVFIEDILTFDFSILPRIDILIQSPPCQDQSRANPRHKHDTTYIEKALEIRDLLKPKFWIIENHPDVSRLCKFNRYCNIKDKQQCENGCNIKKRCNKFESFFLEQEIKFLNAWEYGLPQIRNRLFAGYYPEPEKMINNYPVILNCPIAQVRGYYHGRESKHRIIQKYRQYYQYLERIGIIFDFDYKIARFNELVNPEIYARIMGFPDDYRFYHEKKNDLYVQIGNAVCPPISRAIWIVIKQHKPIIKQATLMNFS